MKENILCEREEQTVLSNLFEELSGLMQDSDDKEIKDQIHNSLRRMNDTSSYIVLGEEAVGKTSLLRAIFQEILPEQDNMAGDLCEYRWGETDYESPVTEGIQKRFVSSDNMRGISIIDTKGINRFEKSTLEKVQKMTETCSAVFVVFDAGNIRSTRLWDVIETFPKKRMIFFLTKCDTVSTETLKENLEKVKAYMKESDIDAPVFSVSVVKDSTDEGRSSLDSVRSYIRDQVIGENPMLKRQQQSIREISDMLIQYQESFLRRRQQYESDAVILQKINASLDKYVSNHKTIVADFTQKLAVEINKDIDLYEQEIISKMDPYKIKERFKTQDDFTDYLNMVNDNYKAMMNDSVNRKTVEVMKNCMHDLEIIFQEASGYFNERENILALNDRFYGSLSQSRRQIVSETREVALNAGQFYTAMSDASINLFLQVWGEREKYDNKVAMRKFLSIFAGGSTGAAAGVAGTAAFSGFVGGGFGTAMSGFLASVASGAQAIAAGAGANGIAAGIGANAAAVATTGGAAAGSFLTSLTAAATGVAFVAIGVIVGAVVINAIAKKLFDPKFADKMEKNVQECIQQFHDEVDHTRQLMIEQVSGQVTNLFEKELANIDSCFTDFRISVNVESEKIPVLEQKAETIDKLMGQIREMERNIR